MTLEEMKNWKVADVDWTKRYIFFLVFGDEDSNFRVIGSSDRWEDIQELAPMANHWIDVCEGEGIATWEEVGNYEAGPGILDKNCGKLVEFAVRDGVVQPFKRNPFDD